MHNRINCIRVNINTLTPSIKITLLFNRAVYVIVTLRLLRSSSLQCETISDGKSADIPDKLEHGIRVTYDNSESGM